MEWVASTPHTTSEHGVSSITTAHAHTSAASSRLNLRPRRFKWTRPFRRKTKSGFCACAITFQTHSTWIPLNKSTILRWFSWVAQKLDRTVYLPSEGTATVHLDTGFSWFPCVYKQMLRWFPRFQVATTCFVCSPPDLNLVVTNFMFCLHVK